MNYSNRNSHECVLVSLTLYSFGVVDRSAVSIVGSRSEER